MPTVTSPALGTSTLTLAQHIRGTLGLAVPVMLARAGIVIMMTVATVMTGRAGGDELAYLGISLAPQIPMLTVGVALLVGTIVLAAQSDGAGDPQRCGRIWRLSLMVGFVLGVVYAAILLGGEDILLLLGQSPDIAARGGRALVMLAPGMPPILMFAATSFFLEGIGRPRPGMVVALAANVVNAGLAWVLIDGHLGMPAMGAAGATLAMSVTNWLMCLALCGYVLAMPEGPRYGVRAPLAGHVGMVRTLLAMGAPLAVAIGLESSAFAATATFAGRLGADSLAGYQVALNVVTLAYMLSIGLSTATAVRVANAVGRGDRTGLERAGWVGTTLVFTLMIAVALVIGLNRGSIAALYTDDPAVRAVAVMALGIAAWIVVADGTQGVLMGAMRGAADLVVPTAAYAVAYWVLAVPLGYYFGVHGGNGIPGLMWSLFAGLVMASMMLGGRFRTISSRLIRPA